jgi:hypothetical protein
MKNCYSSFPYRSFSYGSLILLNVPIWNQIYGLFFGDLDRMSCSSCFPYNEGLPALCLMAGGNLQSLRLLVGLSVSLLSWPAQRGPLPTSPFQSLAYQLQCVRLQSGLSAPKHICAYVETTCVPRAWSKRCKMISKRHSGNWANRNEGCFQEGWQPHAGLIDQWGDWGQPQEIKGSTPQEQVLRTIPASNRAACFLWQEDLFIWGKWIHSING